jgi:hypothetical protein
METYTIVFNPGIEWPSQSVYPFEYGGNQTTVVYIGARSLNRLDIGQDAFVAFKSEIAKLPTVIGVFIGAQAIEGGRAIINIYTVIERSDRALQKIIYKAEMCLMENFHDLHSDFNFHVIALDGELLEDVLPISELSTLYDRTENAVTEQAYSTCRT